MVDVARADPWRNAESRHVTTSVPLPSLRASRRQPPRDSVRLFVADCKNWKRGARLEAPDADVRGRVSLAEDLADLRRGAWMGRLAGEEEIALVGCAAAVPSGDTTIALVRVASGMLIAEVQLILQAYLVAKTVQHRSYEAQRAARIFDLLRAPLYKEPWREASKGSQAAVSPAAVGWPIRIGMSRTGNWALTR